MALRVRSFGMSDVGRARDNNEDAFLVDEVTGLYLVADGMGGHASGDVASRLACENVFRVMRTARQSPDFSFPFEIEERRTFEENALANSVKVANEKIFRASQEVEEYHGMGTTVVAVLEDPDRMITAHVGDSRAYRLREGRITQLTKDHSLLNHYIEERGMSYEEASRLTESNVILRAVGLKEWTEVDVAVVEKVAGDLFLLCSDGLTDQVADETIERILNEHGDDMKGACERLVELANEAGGIDNCTILLVRVYDDGDVEVVRSARPTGKRRAPGRPAGMGDAPPPPPSKGGRRGPAPPPSAAARMARAMRERSGESPLAPFGLQASAEHSAPEPAAPPRPAGRGRGESLPSVIVDLGTGEDAETAIVETQPLSRKAFERYAAKQAEKAAPATSAPGPAEDLDPPTAEMQRRPTGPVPDLDDAETSIAVSRPVATLQPDVDDAETAVAMRRPEPEPTPEPTPTPEPEPAAAPEPAPEPSPAAPPFDPTSPTKLRAAAALRRALESVRIEHQVSGEVDTQKIPRADDGQAPARGERIGVAASAVTRAED